MNRITRIATAVLTASCLTIPVAAAAQDVTLKLGWTTSDSKMDPYAVGAHLFKDKLEELSGGSITVELYPSRQLGDEKQMMEGLRFGTVDAALTTNSVVTQMEERFGLFDLPFIFASAEKAHTLLDSEVGAELAATLEPKGIVDLGYMEGGFRHMLNNRHPITQPADVEGVKFRVMQSPMFIQMFDSLGGAPVPMAWGETFTAIQQGTIDGLEGAVSVFYASNFQDVSKYISLTRHNYSTVHLLMSQMTMNKLSDEQKAAVREAARHAVEGQRARNAELEKESIRLITDAGVTVNEVADLSEFRTLMEPVYANYRDNVDAELLDRALEILK